MMKSDCQVNQSKAAEIKKSNSANRPDAAFLQRQAHAISAMAEYFLRGEEIEQIYSRVSGWVKQVLELKGCLVLERSRGEKESCHLFSECGFCDINQLESTNWLDNVQFLENIKKDSVIIVEDYGRDGRYTPPNCNCFREFLSGMSVRITGEDEPRGIIAVYHEKPRKYKNHEIDFLKTVSNMLAGALYREQNESILRENEARLNAILDTAVDGIITIDGRGRITLFNQAACRIFGYTEQEVMGNDIKMLMPEPYSSEHGSYMRNYTKTGKQKIIGRGREMKGLRKDGSTFPLYLAVSEFHSPSGRSFTGIVRDVSEQRRLEQEVLNVSDHERRRIGQDLHDGLGQMLTGIGLMSRSLEKRLQKNKSDASQQAGEITQLIRKADEYAKNLSRGLLPVDFEIRGLVTSLERLAANAERLFGITCRFHEENPPLFHNTSVDEHLFRIAQEAISNAVKHGMASKVDLMLYATPEYACLQVTDNGKGFPGSWQEKKGSGIDIMLFRAQLIGANLDIRNREEGGAELNCILPRTETVYRMESE